MTLEKLQLIATAAVEPEYKVRWLKWWNSGSFNREAIRFPKSPASEDTLKPWLNKAAFWAGVCLLSLSLFTFQPSYCANSYLGLDFIHSWKMPRSRSCPIYLMHWVGSTETWNLIHCRSTWRSGESAFGIRRSLVTSQGQIYTESGCGGRMLKALTTLSSA